MKVDPEVSLSRGSSSVFTHSQLTLKFAKTKRGLGKFTLYTNSHRLCFTKSF